MSGPLLIVVINLLSALLLMVLSDNPGLTKWLGVGSSFLLAAFCMWFPIGEALSFAGISIKVTEDLFVFGRLLRLGEVNRLMAAVLYACIGLYYFSVDPAVIRRRFLSTGMIMAAGSAAALMVNPQLYASIFVLLTVLAGAFMLEHTDTRNSGAVFLISIHILSMIALLLAGWTLDTVGVTPGATDLAFSIRLLLGFAAGVLMSIPPFTIWILKANREAQPVEWVFILMVLQITGIFLFLGFLREYSLLMEDETIMEFLMLGGVVLLYGASFWGALQRQPERFLILAVTADIGITIIGVSTMEQGGLTLGLISNSARMLCLILVSAALTVLRRKDRQQIYPVEMLVLFIAFITAAGFPLTAGFPSRWLIMTESLKKGAVMAGNAVFIATVITSLTALRWVVRFITQYDTAASRQFRPQDWTHIVLVAISLMHAVVPDILNFWLSDLIAAVFVSAG